MSLILSESEIESIGSWEKVLNNFERRFEMACSRLGGLATIPLYYQYDAYEKLVKSDIDVSDLKTISKKSIFRVYSRDGCGTRSVAFEEFHGLELERDFTGDFGSFEGCKYCAMSGGT